MPAVDWGLELLVVELVVVLVVVLDGALLVETVVEDVDVGPLLAVLWLVAVDELGVELVGEETVSVELVEPA